MLLWIVCVDNLYKIYAVSKVSNAKYPKKIDWRYKKQKYRDAKFMHRWYPMLDQSKGKLTIKLGMFLTKECIKGCQWWECPKN